MFDSVYVHVEKNKAHWDQIKHDCIYIDSSKRENISIWKKFKTLDDLITSSLWFEACDMAPPLYARGGDYCPLCTRDTNHEIITSIFDWGCCKDCVVVHCDDDYITDYKGRDYTIIGDVNNRPIIFSYWNRPSYQTNILITEVEKYLQVINNKLQIKREYNKKYIDESPETIEKIRKNTLDIFQKLKEKEEQEDLEYERHKYEGHIPITQYFTVDKQGNMREASYSEIESYDPYSQLKY